MTERTFPQAMALFRALADTGPVPKGRRVVQSLIHFVGG